MDIPTKVYITSPMAELKRVPGTLIAVSPLGFYEVHIAFGSNTHPMLLPVAETVLLAQEPILAALPGFDLER